MLQRPRRLRRNAAIRSLQAENHLRPEDFIAPLFIIPGEQQKEEIASMPNYFRYSLDLALEEVKSLTQLGCRAVLLFVKVEEQLKDNSGKEALNPGGLMQEACRAIKEDFPEVLVMTDVALDPYSSYGHDGIVEEGTILNDETLEVLTEMAVTQAQAGADFVAPSDMMDGRVEAIRRALDMTGFDQVGIMSYTAKYASCFYGPFRDALDSAPGFGDKKSYQMDPANGREAEREAQLDEQEGADILMVKPALAYLDIIRRLREQSKLPISAYHVSGEYAMIKAAAEKGWLDETAAMVEALTSIKRAGADLIATYFVKDILTLLQKENA